MWLHVLPPVKLNLRSMIKVAHRRKLFCQLGHRVGMLHFSVVDRGQTPLRRCGQSRALQLAAVVKAPNVTLITSQLRNSLQDGRAVWRIITILQYLALSHVVHC